MIYKIRIERWTAETTIIYFDYCNKLGQVLITRPVTALINDEYFNGFRLC